MLCSMEHKMRYFYYVLLHVFSCLFKVKIGLVRVKECPAGLEPTAGAKNRQKYVKNT